MIRSQRATPEAQRATPEETSSAGIPASRISLLRLTAVGVALAVVAVFAAGCGSDEDTTTVTSTTSPSPEKSTTSTLSDDSLEAAIATFTKLGFKEDQARCLVEHMSDLSEQIGSTSSLSDKDRTKIEELMEDCGITDSVVKDALGG